MKINKFHSLTLTHNPGSYSYSLSDAWNQLFGVGMSPEESVRCFGALHFVIFLKFYKKVLLSDCFVNFHLNYKIIFQYNIYVIEYNYTNAYLTFLTIFKNYFWSLYSHISSLTSICSKFNLNDKKYLKITEVYVQGLLS